MDIPIKYGIINLINNNKESNSTIVSYNGYEKKKLFEKIKFAWDSNELELSFSLLAEIHVSFYLNDLINLFINYFSEQLINSNIFYSFFLLKNLQKINSLKKYYPKNKHKFILVNSSEMRNILSEINYYFTIFKKKDIVIHLGKNCLSPEKYIKKSNIKIENELYDKNGFKITKKLSKGLSEIYNFIDNHNENVKLNDILFWIYWTNEAEKYDKKNLIDFYSKIKFYSGNKSLNDYTTFIWNRIISKLNNCNSNKKSLIKILYKLYYFKYNKSQKNKRLNLIGFAISILNKNININFNKEIDELYIYCMLKINIFYSSIIAGNLVDKNREEYIKYLNEFDKKHLKRNKITNQNYKIAKINNKMDYLNILIYKNKEDNKKLENINSENNNKLIDSNIKKYF